MITPRRCGDAVANSLRSASSASLSRSSRGDSGSGRITFSPATLEWRRGQHPLADSPTRAFFRSSLRIVVDRHRRALLRPSVMVGYAPDVAGRDVGDRLLAKRHRRFRSRKNERANELESRIVVGLDERAGYPRRARQSSANCRNVIWCRLLRLRLMRAFLRQPGTPPDRIAVRSRSASTSASAFVSFFPKCRSSEKR